MKIVIFGTGGVGGYFGGRLVQSGQEVTFIARGVHLDAIRRSGLRVDSVNGDFIISPAETADSTQSIRSADLILVGVKAWQLNDALGQIRPLVESKTMLLPLLNGVEHMETLRDTFGAEHILGGMCRISAFIEAPGYIRHVGIQPYLAYGEWDNANTDRIQTLDEVFKSLPGVTAERPANIRTAMWEKFIFIAATSGVGAYTCLPIGEIRAKAETLTMLQNALEETAAIARAQGVDIAGNFVEVTMKRIETIAPHIIPSMQKDIMEGKPSELDQQTGAVIRMGKTFNIPTPTHEKIYSTLLPLEQKARSR